MPWLFKANGDAGAALTGLKSPVGGAVAAKAPFRPWGEYIVSLSWRRKLILFFLFQAVLFLVYSGINHFLFEKGIINPFLLFFGEKSLLALKGVPPRLENMGFIYPPLPVILSIIFGTNVLLAQNFIASGITAYLILETLSRVHPPRFAAILIGYMLLSAPMLFLGAQRFDLYLHFFLTVLSIRFFYLYTKIDYSFYIFAAGLTFGLTFFVHFSSIYLIPVFVFIVFILYAGNIRKFLAVSLVFFTPYMLLFLSFGYLNWIFTGEAWGFLTNYRLLFSNHDIDAVLASGNIQRSFMYMLNFVYSLFFVILPCLLAMYYDRRAVAVIPFAMIFSFVFANLFFPTVYFSAIFIIYFLLVPDIWGKTTGRPLLMASMAISLVASALFAYDSVNPSERAFARAFTGVYESNTAVYDSALKVLNSGKGRILMDDTSAYPIIYLVKNPERFILPYRYEFTPAISNPWQFADYVVIARDKEKDRIYQRFGDRIKGYNVVLDDGIVSILEKAQ